MDTRYLDIKLSPANGLKNITQLLKTDNRF